MIFLHFILVLPSPFALGVPNAKVGLTKTAKSEGIFLVSTSVVHAVPTDGHVLPQLSGV